MTSGTVVSGPAPPPPPPPPANHSDVQQSKSVLRKSQRTCASVTGNANQSLNHQHAATKESGCNKVIERNELHTGCLLKLKMAQK